MDCVFWGCVVEPTLGLIGNFSGIPSLFFLVSFLLRVGIPHEMR